MVCALSCYIGPSYDGTWLHYESQVYNVCNDQEILYCLFSVFVVILEPTIVGAKPLAKSLMSYGQFYEMWDTAPNKSKMSLLEKCVRYWESTI